MTVRQLQSIATVYTGQRETGARTITELFDRPFLCGQLAESLSLPTAQTILTCASTTTVWLSASPPPSMPSYATR
jgi:hypothetical protein